jgi:hypothetical protein
MVKTSRSAHATGSAPVGPDVFLQATQDDARAIAELIDTLGHVEAQGVIRWYALHAPEPMFLDGAGLCAPSNQRRTNPG